MRRFEAIFAAARRDRRCVLIPYITAGDPSLEDTAAIAVELAAAGAEIIELGVPFSDPVADGPVIQAASERALARGVTLTGVLEAARTIRRQTPVGLLLFSYYNPMLQFGLEKLATAAADAGCDGILATDLIPEEASVYRAAMQAAGLDTVFLAAPTSPDARLAAIAQASTGFIYAVSRLGVTGSAISWRGPQPASGGRPAYARLGLGVPKPQADAAPTTVAPGAAELVARLRRQMPLPIALGFGLARAEQVAVVAEYVDAAVVGTALVDCIARAAPGKAPSAAGAFVRSLRTSVSAPDR